MHAAAGGATPMSRPAAGFTGDTALVAGELCGYRQFQLRRDGLYPLFRPSGAGGPAGPRRRNAPTRLRTPPLTGPVAVACMAGIAPLRRPVGSAEPTRSSPPADGSSSATEDSGRPPRGSKLSRSRSAPGSTRLRRGAGARRMLATCYPNTKVYQSRRLMLREYPPQPVDALGIRPHRDHTHACSRVTAAGRVLFLAVASLPSCSPHRSWPLAPDVRSSSAPSLRLSALTYCSGWSQPSARRGPLGPATPHGRKPPTLRTDREGPLEGCNWS